MFFTNNFQEEHLSKTLQLDYELYARDIKIMEFNLNTYYVKIIIPELLPPFLQSSLKMTNVMKDIFDNIMAIQEFLSGRVLSLSRENAKLLLNALQLPTSNKMEDRLKIAIACNALSLTDSFWICQKGINLNWNDINLFHNKLNASLTSIILEGTPSITTFWNDCRSPDLTTGGMFKKAWIRLPVGDRSELWLAKSDKTSDQINTQAELISSNILDLLESNHVNYIPWQESKKLISICKCMTDEFTGFISYSDCSKYFNKYPKILEMVIELYRVDYANMLVADYILSNTDRHVENWGYMWSMTEGIIVCQSKLFDHNLCLIADQLGNSENIMSYFHRGSLKDIALQVIDECTLNLEKCRDMIDTIDFMHLDKAREKILERLNILIKEKK